MSTKKSTAQKKFTMKQLAAGPSTVELVHPFHGETGIKITVRTPYSAEVRAAIKEFMNSEKNEVDNAKVLFAYFLEWDEEAFEAPLTLENAIEFLTADDNYWVVEFLSNVLKSPETFFKKKQVASSSTSKNKLDLTDESQTQKDEI